MNGNVDIKASKRRLLISFDEIAFIIKQQKSMFGPEIYINVFGYFLDLKNFNKMDGTDYHFFFRAKEEGILDDFLEILSNPGGFSLKITDPAIHGITKELYHLSKIEYYCSYIDDNKAKTISILFAGTAREFLKEHCRCGEGGTG